MTEQESVDLSPDLLVYLSFFTIITTWTFTGINMGMTSLIIVTPSFTSWLLFSSLLVLTYPIPIIGVSRYAKIYTKPLDLDWTYVTRDVSFDEYQELVNEYNSGYSHIMTILFPLRILISIILGVLAITLPYVLSQLTIIPLLFSAPGFGVCLLVLGIGLVSAIFPAIPGNLSHEFPCQVTKKFRTGTRYLSQLPGIYWTGIRITLGEWAGYYTLRDPTLTARIEGIESIVAVNCEINTSGTITEVSFSNESDHEGFPMTDPIRNPSSEAIKESMKDIVLWYIDLSEDEELLQEVLDELSM
jgi:hypothetical protein